MRKIFTVGLIGCLTILLSSAAFASGAIKVYVNGKQLETDVNPMLMNDRILLPIRAITEAFGEEIEWDDKTNSVFIEKKERDNEQRIRLLEDWIIPNSATAAASTWAEAVKQRNGAVQYALLADNLVKEKEQIKELGWVTGVSSPWVESYTIKEDDNNTFTVTFQLATSTGTAGEEIVKLTIEPVDNKYKIVNIEYAE